MTSSTAHQAGIKLSLIGIGCGDPGQLTLAAIRAINAADLILIPRKGDEKSELAGLRRAICADVLTNEKTRVVEFDLPVRDTSTADLKPPRHKRRVPFRGFRSISGTRIIDLLVPMAFRSSQKGVAETDRELRKVGTSEEDYRKGVDEWHDAVAATWSREIEGHLGNKGRVALLIWGDPSLYDSSLRIARRLDPAPDIEVVPGVTSIQALCAAHALPVNDIGEPFLVTTGRRLRADGWPAGVNTVVVMLDGGTAFQSLEPEGLNIWWGAYLGMSNEILMSGALAEVGPSIMIARSEARERHGWIMDSYILKRIS